MREFLIVFLIAMAVIASCDGGKKTPPPSFGEAIYTVGGTASGIVGAIVIQNNGKNDLTIEKDGEFNFPQKAVYADEYRISIAKKPDNRVCHITDGIGKVQAAKIDKILVRCYDINDPNIPPPPPPPTVAWTKPLDLTSLTGNDFFASSPKVALNKNDSSVILWNGRTSKDLGDKIFMSKKINGIWERPTENDALPIGWNDATNTKIGMDEDGNIVVTWKERINGIEQLYSGIYINKDMRWSTPNKDKPVSNVTDQNNKFLDVFDYEFIMKSNTGILVWYQGKIEKNTVERVYAATYRKNSTSIQPAELISNSSGDYAVRGPSADINAGENMIFSWLQLENGPAKVFVKRCTIAGCSTPSAESSNAGSTNVALFDNGDAIIIWEEAPDPKSSNKSFYISGKLISNKIEAPFKIELGGGDPSSIKIATNVKSEAILVWSQSDGKTARIYKSIFKNGQWTHPSNLNDYISPKGETNAINPQVVVNSNGDSIIVWEQHDGKNWRIYKSESVNGIWINPTGTDDSLSEVEKNAYNPSIALNDSGNAIITWEQDDQSAKRQIYMIEKK